MPTLPRKTRKAKDPSLSELLKKKVQAGRKAIAEDQFVIRTPQASGDPLDTLHVGVTEEEFDLPELEFSEPTVATKDNPIVDRERGTPPPASGGISESEFTIGARDQFGKEIGKPTLEQSQIESDIAAVEKRKGEQLTESQSIFEEELARETERIRAAGQRTKDQLSKSLALRGGLRGTAGEQRLGEEQEKINALISTAERKADLELQLRDAKIRGASGEELESLNKNLNTLKQSLAEQEELNIQAQLDIASEIGADALETVLGILEATGSNTDTIDQEKSRQAGYLLNGDGSLFLGATGKPVALNKTLGTDQFSAADIDNFATGIASGNFKPSDLKLDPFTYSQVISAINAKQGDKPGLSINRIKAQRILKDLGLGVDANSVDTVTNLLKTLGEEEVRNMIATDEFKQASFVGGNQKLFDDLRKDSQSFKDIDRTFSGMNDIWNDFKNNPSESRAAMEQALIIMFNKMLDPGSVVREGEFDRTSEGQSILNAAEGWLQKLAKGGAGIKNEAFEDIVNIAKVLHGASLDTVTDIKTSYKSFAGDLGANPEFVDRFFEVGFDGGDKIEITETTTADTLFDDIFGGGEVGATFTGVTVKSDEDIGSFLDN